MSGPPPTAPGPHPPASGSAHLEGQGGGTPAAPRGASRRSVVAVIAVAMLVGVLVLGAGLRQLGVPSGSSQDDGVDTAARLGASADGYAVWERNDDGVPVRWDPCSPIEVVVATEGVPSGAMADVTEAVDRLVEATGLDLRVTGTTTERPHADRPPYQPERYGHRWAPVLLAWAPPHEGGIRLRTTDRGVAVPIAVGSPGDRTYVTAQIVFNAERGDLEPGFEERSRSWGATVLHELAHALGLDHVDDPDQIMYVHPGEGPVELGDGDLDGLAAVGAEHGCRTVPTPQHVEVADPPR